MEHVTHKGWLSTQLDIKPFERPEFVSRVKCCTWSGVPCAPSSGPATRRSAALGPQSFNLERVAAAPARAPVVRGSQSSASRPTERTFSRRRICRDARFGFVWPSEIVFLNPVFQRKLLVGVWGECYAGEVTKVMNCWGTLQGRTEWNKSFQTF